MPIILSVSQDKELLFLREKVLESAGFRVISVLSAEDAVRELVKQKPDALLIGHSISTDEAVEMARSAKQVHPSVKVCRLQRAWTAQVDGGVIDSFIDSLGNPGELIQCLNDALRKAGSTGASV